LVVGDGRDDGSGGGGDVSLADLDIPKGDVPPLFLTSPTLVLPSNTIIPGDTRGLCRTSILSAAIESSDGLRSGYDDVPGALSEVKHSATNFRTSNGVVFIGFIDNDNNDGDDVLLNGLLAFIDITPAPADPDRDLEASDTFDQSTGENPGGGVAERADGTGRGGVDVDTSSVSAVVVVVGSTSMRSLVCRCGGEPTTNVTLGDNLIFSLVASAASDADEGVGSEECDPCSSRPKDASSLGAPKKTLESSFDFRGAGLMVAEVVSLTPAGLSPAAAFPTERTSERAVLDTVESRQR